MKGWLATVRSLPGNWPGYHAMGVRGRLRFDRSLPRRSHRLLRAQGLSGEAVKGNPPTTVIPGVDESKPSPRTTEDSTEPEKTYNPETVLFRRKCRIHPLCVMSDLRPNWNQARLLLHTRMPWKNTGR